MNIGERFALLRKHQGLTQDVVAKKYGVVRDAWRRYEGGAVPNGTTLEAIARDGYSIDWLLTGAGTMVFAEAKAASADADPSRADQMLAIVRAATGSDMTIEPVRPDMDEALDAARVALQWGPQGFGVAKVILTQLLRMIEEAAKG